MIAHSLLFEAKPERATELCGAIREKLGLWRNEAGFIDLLILSESEGNVVEALSFWRGANDAGRFAANGGARLGQDLRHLLMKAPRAVQRRLSGSTNRMLVPEVPEVADVAEFRRDPKAEGAGPRPQPTSPARIVSQGMKAPAALFLTGLETVLQISRRVQAVYETSVDSILQPVTSQQPGRTQTAVLKAETDITRDTLSGLIAFVVPGPDAYSVAQGVSTPEPGGLAAGVLDAVIVALDRTQPSKPGAPPASAAAAGALNAIAQKVDPAAAGSFVSPFARLSFASKAAVFQAVEANPATQALAGLLPLTAFLTYSEVGVFDRTTRTLRGWPIGWTISAYEGVGNGCDDFKGYYEDRRAADPASCEMELSESGI